MVQFSFENKNENDRSIETVINEKMAAVRITASNLFRKRALNEDGYKSIVDKIRSTATLFPSLNPNDVQEQLILANKAFATGEVTENIRLDHPLYQFIWGLALMRIAAQPKQMEKWPEENRSENGLVNSKIWEQIKNTDEMHSELSAFTTMLASRGTVHQSTLIRWGGTNYPNVGYYFSPSENLVNLDMLWAMVGGFEHMKAIVFHEFAHSSGTVQFTPVLIESRKRINELAQKKNRTEEEKEELKHLRAHDSARFMIYDEAENSFANGYAKMLSQRGYYHQDLAYSLNAVETQLFGVGYEYSKDEIAQDNFLDILINVIGDAEEKTAMHEFINLKKVIRYGFFTNNELFENTVENWEKIGVHVDWIKGYDKDGNLLTGKEAIDELVEISEQLETLQIPVTTRRYGKYEKIQKACLERGKIIDDLYERFAKEIVERMREEELNKMKQASQNRKQQSDDQKQGNNDGDEQTGDKQLGDDEQDTKGQKGSDGEDKQDGTQQQSGDEQQDGTQQLTGDEQEGVGNDEQQDGTRGKGQDSDKQQGSDDDSNEPLVENPQEDRVNRKKTKDNDQGKTTEDIAQEEKERQKQKQKKNQNETNPDNDSKDSMITELNQSLRKSNFVPPVYRKEINAYTQIITKHAALLKKIKELFKQLRNTYIDDNNGHEQELLPAGTIQDSLDIDSVVYRMQKMRTGQQVDIDDYRHFRNPNEPIQKQAPIDICVFIDVSGSVEDTGQARFAVELGCLINEALKDSDCFNLYLGLMTTPPQFLAEPNMNDKEIAYRLNTIYNGRNWDGCGDQIAQATIETLKRIQTRKSTNEKEGFTHFFYITDGGHSDGKTAVPLLNHLMDNSPITTFNWIKFVSRWSDEPLRQLEHDREGKTGTKGLIKESICSIDDVLPAFKKILTKRIRDMKRKEAMGVPKKQRILKDILRSITR